MLIKTADDGDRAAMTAEDLHVIRRIIDDFETTQILRRKQGAKGRSRKISRSDSLIHRARVSPMVLRGSRAVSLQDVVRNEDSLYLKICEADASVENADANSPKGLEPTARRSTRAYLGVSKVLDEAAAAAQKKHQEKVMKGVQEVRAVTRETSCW